MQIRYFAYLRDDAGRKEELFEGSSTALALLKALAERHGSALRNHILTPAGDDLHEDLIMLINGRHVEFIGGAHYLIPENATVSLFPRIAGG